MTEDQKKPEWFAMTEGDSAPATPARTSKRLPFIAILATGAILTAGAVFANVREEEPASAEGFRAGNFHPKPDFTPDGKSFPHSDSLTASSPIPRKPPVSPDGQIAPPRQGDDDGDHEFTPGDRPHFEDGEEGEEGEHHFPGGERRGRHDFNRDRNGTASGGTSGGIPSTGTGA